MIDYKTGYKPRIRDRFVHGVCNFLINTLATKEYRAFVWYCFTLGKEQVEANLKDTL